MKADWKGANWLLYAVVFTIVYVGSVAYILGLETIQNFLTTNRSLNEIGDFLAGVLAPVALIWLVAAVLTQRQELVETRAQFLKNQKTVDSQFAENKKVVDAQLTTIKSQNGLLVQQHNQAVENAKQAYRLSLFDMRFQIYKKFVKFGDVHLSKDFDVDSYWAMTNLAQEAAFVFDRSMEDWLTEIAQQIFDYDQFKSANPLRRGDDGMGNHEIVDDEPNTRLRKKYGQFTGWIGEQFLPDVRVEKFWHFLSVSDHPYMQDG